MHSSKPRAAGRFIPSEEVGTATSWNFGDVDPAVALAALKAETQWREREEAREAQQAAYDQGFEAGLNTGREMARREIDKFMQTRGEQAARQMESTASSLEREMTTLRQHMADGLLQLASAIARQIVRTELQTRPETLRAVVAEALETLSSDHAPRVVRLHPEDLALVSGAGFGEAPIQWKADPAIARGGCLVESAGTVVDATVQRRWEQALASCGIPQADADGELAGV